MMAAGWETTKTVSLWVKPEGTPYCTLPLPSLVRRTSSATRPAGGAFHEAW